MLRKKAKKHFLKRLFGNLCQMREYAIEDELELCSGQSTLWERRRDGCQFCTIFIPNAEHWSKKTYPKC